MTPPASAHPATDARSIVYVANAESRDISVLALNEDESGLSLLQTLPIDGRVMPLAIRPGTNYLFAALRSEPYAVSTLSIDPESGRLSPVSTAPLPDNMAYLSTDRTGRYLLAASYSGSRISINAIAPDGTVEPTPFAVIPTGRNAHAIATDLSNRFLFVTCLGDDVILQFRFDAASGEIVPNDPPAVAAAPGAGPRHFVFHPDRQFVFCLNELNGTVTSYRLEEPGTLTPLSSISMLPNDFSGKPWAADIHLTPDGRFLYASERTSSTLAAFAVDSESGSLTLIGHQATETQPRGFTIDGSGACLIVAGEQSNAVSAYAIDRENGRLRHVSRLSVGQGPNWIEIIRLPN